MSAISPSRLLHARNRRVFAVLFGACALLIVLGACMDRARPTLNEEANLNTVVISVEGMSCASCAARVKKAVISIVGVSDVEVSLVERRARVRFDPARVTPEQLAAAINGLRYRAGAPAEAR